MHYTVWVPVYITPTLYLANSLFNGSSHNNPWNISFRNHFIVLQYVKIATWPNGKYIFDDILKAFSLDVVFRFKLHWGWFAKVRVLIRLHWFK